MMGWIYTSAFCGGSIKDYLDPKFTGEDETHRFVARALSDTRFASDILEACPAFEGYAWCDTIGRVTGVLWILAVGEKRLILKDLKGEKASENGEDWRAFSAGDSELFAKPDTITMRLRIDRGGRIETHDFETDVILIGEGYSPEEYLVLQSRKTRDARTLPPNALADLMVHCGFCHSDDAEAESPETQRRNYEIAAYAHAASIPIDKEAGDLAVAREHADASLAWICPRGRRVVIVLVEGRVAAEFRPRSLEDPAADLRAAWLEYFSAQEAVDDCELGMDEWRANVANVVAAKRRARAAIAAAEASTPREPAG
jgi:hypothetical protein